MNNNKNLFDINIEIYRGKIYCEILKYFISILINLFGKKIFSIKKPYQKTLTNLLSSWMFNLYLLYDLNNDQFFPDKFDDTTILKNILLDFCKYDTQIENKEEKIDNVYTQIDNLQNYKQSDLYNNVKYKYNLYKIKIKQKRNNIDVLFYKYKIDLLYNIKDIRLKNILENILIPNDIYIKMVNNYNNNMEFIDIYIWIIIFRYQLLGSNNHQLAILPKIIKNMEKNYNLSFECFASAINTSQKNYCSIFYDIEKYFGSHGNFFNFTPTEGTFSCNPPYEKEIIYKCIYKIFNHLEYSNNKKYKLTFIITIPIWDIEGQKLINQKQHKIDYGDFDIIQKIKESKYFIGLRMILKENFTYIDHNFKLYKNKTIQNTYIIILSTNNINFNHILEYNFFNI